MWWKVDKRRMAFHSWRNSTAFIADNRLAIDQNASPCAAHPLRAPHDDASGARLSAKQCAADVYSIGEPIR